MTVVERACHLAPLIGVILCSFRMSLLHTFINHCQGWWCWDTIHRLRFTLKSHKIWINKWVRKLEGPHITYSTGFIFSLDVIKCIKCKITNSYIWLFPVGAFIFGCGCSRYHGTDWENHTKCITTDSGGWWICIYTLWSNECLIWKHDFKKSDFLPPCFLSRWSGCRTPLLSRLPVHWISEKTWLAVSICSCVERSRTSIPPMWLWVSAHLDRRLTACSSLETVPVSGGVNSLGLTVM